MQYYTDELQKQLHFHIRSDNQIDKVLHILHWTCLEDRNKIVSASIVLCSHLTLPVNQGCTKFWGNCFGICGSMNTTSFCDSLKPPTLGWHGSIGETSGQPCICCNELQTGVVFVLLHISKHAFQTESRVWISHLVNMYSIYVQTYIVQTISKSWTDSNFAHSIFHAWWWMPKRNKECNHQVLHKQVRSSHVNCFLSKILITETEKTWKGNLTKSGFNHYFILIKRATLNKASICPDKWFIPTGSYNSHKLFSHIIFTLLTLHTNS